MRILVTGASGLLGVNYSLRFFREHEITGVTFRQKMNGTPFTVIQKDLTIPGEVRSIIDKTRPDVVIHCAAIANLDECEHRPGDAERTNGWLPGEMARITQRLGIQLVHISTDAIFSGQDDNNDEKSEPHPLNVYARTKLAGEKEVEIANPQALIARVNFYGWSLGGSRSLAEFFINQLSQGKEAMGFTDVTFCPLVVRRLAEIIDELVKKRIQGIIHIFSPQSCSKYEFGVALAKAFGFEPGLIRPVSVAEARLAAERPKRLVMNIDRLRSLLSTDISDLEEGIKIFKQEFDQGLPQLLRRYTD